MDIGETGVIRLEEEIDRDTLRTGTRTGMDLDLAVDETTDTVLAATRGTLNRAVPGMDDRVPDTAATGMTHAIDTIETEEGPVRMIDVDDPTPDRDRLCRETVQLDDVKAEGEGIRDRLAPARGVGLVPPDLEAAAGPGRTLPTLLDPAHLRARRQGHDHPTRKVLGADLVREALEVKAIREAPFEEQSRQDEVRVHEGRPPPPIQNNANKITNAYAHLCKMRGLCTNRILQESSMQQPQSQCFSSLLRRGTVKLRFLERRNYL